MAVIFALVSLIKSQPIGNRSFFEPGVMLVGLFSLCYLAPTLAILLGAETLTSDTDPAILELLSLYGFLFIVSFALFYKIPERFFPQRLIQATNLKISLSPKSCFLGYVLLFVIIKLIFKYYGVGDAEDYISQYVLRASIPTEVAQGVTLLQSIQWMLLYLLFVSSFVPSSRKYPLRFVWYVLIIFLCDMLLTNSRSGVISFVLLFLATRMLYVRPIGLRKELLFSILLIVGMGLFAFRRVVSTEAIDVNFLDTMLPSEFLMVHFNAANLLSFYNTSDFIPPPGSSYLQAIISIFPKQLNPEKWDLANWYVNAYFPDFAKIGGGLAFGIIPEALVNWGLFSMAFQAFVVAVILRFAYFSAYRNRYSGLNVWILFYLFCYSQIYQLIRSHSFVIISGLLLGFVIPFIFVYLLNRLRFTWAR